MNSNPPQSKSKLGTTSNNGLTLRHTRQGSKISKKNQADFFVPSQRTQGPFQAKNCPKSEAIPDSHRLPQAVYPSLNDMSSPTQDYLGFIFSVGDAIKGLKIRDESKQNLAPVQGLIDLLKTLTLWIEEIPPLQQEQRFGNKAFRDWYTKLQNVRM